MTYMIRLGSHYSGRLKNWFKAHNAPLYLNPQILDEVLKYVCIPKDMEAGYRRHAKTVKGLP